MSYQLFTNKFPREVGIPNRRLVLNERDYWDLVNAQLGKTHLYASVYSFPLDEGTPVYSNAFIETVFFDLDGNNAYEYAVSLNCRWKELGIKHRINFSGRGFQLFVFTDGIQPQNKKGAVANYQIEICKELGIPVKDKDGLDPAVVGNLAQIARIPNTMNVKPDSMLYCIPLSQKMLEIGYENIKKLAKKQQSVPYQERLLGGNGLLSLAPYDKELPPLSVPIGSENFDEGKFLDRLVTAEELNVYELNKISPCAKLVLCEEPSYEVRKRAILWFFFNGFTEEDVTKIFRHFFNAKTFRHCVIEMHEVADTFRRKGIHLEWYSWEKMSHDGFCPLSKENCPCVKNMHYIPERGT